MSTPKLRDSLIDNVTTRLLDFHQRRITNAHPSVDDYDYVVRKELKDLGGVSVAPTSGGGGFKGITWNIGVGSGQAVASNVACTPPLPYGGSCVQVRVCQKTWDTGSGDTIFDILKSSDNGSTWATLLTANITITENNTNSEIYTSVSGSVVAGDLVRFDVISGIAHDLGIVLELA
jgi:hypothetical protein